VKSIGANYGYSLREGNQKLDAANHLSDLTGDDRIPVQINATETDGTVTPAYAVLQYGHVKGGGDAISSGYIYRGKAIPALAARLQDEGAKAFVKSWDELMAVIETKSEALKKAS